MQIIPEGFRKIMDITIKALVLVLSVSTVALAADTDVLRCRNITEASVRLACYDAIALPAPRTQSTAGKPASHGEDRELPLGTARRSAASPSVSSQQNADQFGLENRAVPGKVDAIESFIPGRFEGWEAKSNVRLANGQVWQIADDSRRNLSLNDPKVRIRRGVMGAFYLEFEKVNHSPRIRRVQ